MSHITFIECTEDTDCNNIERGCKVLLKSEDEGLPYDIEVVVAGVTPENMVGYVDKIYDTETSDGQLSSDSMVDSLAGYEVSFKSTHIHKFIKSE